MHGTGHRVRPQLRVGLAQVPDVCTEQRCQRLHVGVAELREEEQLNPVLDAVDLRQLQIGHGRGTRIEILEVRSRDVEIAVERIVLQRPRRAPQLQLRREAIGAIAAGAVSQLHDLGFRVVPRELRREDRRRNRTGAAAADEDLLRIRVLLRHPVHHALRVGKPAVRDVEPLAVTGFEALGAHAEVHVGRAVRREHDRELAQGVRWIGRIEDAAHDGLVQPRAIAVVDRVLEGLLTVQAAIAAVPAATAALEIDRDPPRVALVHVELVRRGVGRAAGAVSAGDGFPPGGIDGRRLVGARIGGPCGRAQQCREPGDLRHESAPAETVSCWGYLSVGSLFYRQPAWQRASMYWRMHFRARQHRMTLLTTLCIIGRPSVGRGRKSERTCTTRSPAKVPPKAP